MPKKKKRERNSPEPLNFDHDAAHLRTPSPTRSDNRGDNEEEQYYEEEEALSPEEVKKRKEEGTM
jgi:hypothetical protein